MSTPPTPDSSLRDDALLAKLGYKQELNRSWSGSRTSPSRSRSSRSWPGASPPSVRRGTTAGRSPSRRVADHLGVHPGDRLHACPSWSRRTRPRAASTGGPPSSAGPKPGYYTGWLNLIGLLAVTASVAYGAATFLDLTISTISSSWADGYSLTRVFILFVAIMLLAALANIFSGHLLAIVNNISVWWHVAGAAIVILILIIVPDHHQSISYVYTERINNSGFCNGFYWFLVLPLGFLLTQYTITGFDASAHLSEETQGAAEGAAKGIWRSIFYSAIGGYVLLLSFVFAVQDPQGVSDGFGKVDVIFGQALGEGWHFLSLLISTVGQLFCATACLTSASRMTFAFSRDGAIPGSKTLSGSTRAPTSRPMR